MQKPPYRKSVEAEIPERMITPKRDAGREIAMRLANGTDTSFMLASREPGYHSQPHRHDAEQLNYIVDGEIWLFVEAHGYRCVRGDLMRIPRNRVHWAWVRGAGPCTMIELHSPPLIGDAMLRDASVSLLGADEDAGAVRGAENIHVDYDVAATERRALAEAGETGRRPPAG
jgi:quercetin dioxygenase-like cupin family protein